MQIIVIQAVHPILKSSMIVGRPSNNHRRFYYGMYFTLFHTENKVKLVRKEILPMFQIQERMVESSRRSQIINVSTNNGTSRRFS
jgi:hypothetical protein